MKQQTGGKDASLIVQEGQSSPVQEEHSFEEVNAPQTEKHQQEIQQVAEKVELETAEEETGVDDNEYFFDIGQY